MATVTLLIASFCLFALTVHLAGILAVLVRDVARAKQPPAGTRLPGVTILRPVRGIENHLEETLRSAFELDHDRYEVVFCVADADDPVIALCEKLIAEHPAVPARILVGDDRISVNPKLNNLVKGWADARHEFVVMADSNVLMPRDYLAQLFAAWKPDTGLVCSPPVGSRPDGFCAEIECAFLNSFQGRWQLAADAVGIGFAQGKTMLWRKADLDRAGGIAQLASEAAEDAASTKVVRGAGLKVRLVRRPFPQPLGKRSLAEVWNRQLRWARLRRMSFPLFFAPEVLAGGFLPVLGAVVLAVLGTIPAVAAAGFAVLWYGAEVVLALRLGWPVSAKALAAWIVRDASLPVLWFAALGGNGFNWRGNAMDMRNMVILSSAPATAMAGEGSLAAGLRWRSLRQSRAVSAMWRRTPRPGADVTGRSWRQSLRAAMSRSGRKPRD